MKLTDSHGRERRAMETTVWSPWLFGAAMGSAWLWRKDIIAWRYLSLLKRTRARQPSANGVQEWLHCWHTPRAIREALPKIFRWDPHDPRHRRMRRECLRRYH